MGIEVQYKKQFQLLQSQQENCICPIVHSKTMMHITMQRQYGLLAIIIPHLINVPSKITNHIVILLQTQMDPETVQVQFGFREIAIVMEQQLSMIV